MRTTARLLAAVGIGVLTCAAGPATASEGFRCGNRVINTGASLYEVKSKCGAPDSADQRIEKREVAHRVRVRSGAASEEVEEKRIVEVVIDEWTYDLGRSRFIRYLHFENGRLLTVSEGDWGFKD